MRKEILKTELSPTAASTLGLKTQTMKDQQVIADAIRASAQYLITTDVDDFAFDDLAAHEMSAVNPDYFMALRFTEVAYREGVSLLAEVQRNPSRTEADVHQVLGRRHPRLATRFGDTYETPPVSADADQPSVIFRGVACIRCEAHLVSEEGLRIGLRGQHLPTD